MRLRLRGAVLAITTMSAGCFWHERRDPDVYYGEPRRGPDWEREHHEQHEEERRDEHRDRHEERHDSHHDHHD
ncbi:MAG: hypothetical protein M3O50_19175 [Myxococcota bacterium]|nr:hypothetical protein [Myxococcota bacterium]